MTASLPVRERGRRSGFGQLSRERGQAGHLGVEILSARFRPVSLAYTSGYAGCPRGGRPVEDVEIDEGRCPADPSPIRILPEGPRPLVRQPWFAENVACPNRVVSEVACHDVAIGVGGNVDHRLDVVRLQLREELGQLGADRGRGWWVCTVPRVLPSSAQFHAPVERQAQAPHRVKSRVLTSVTSLSRTLDHHATPRWDLDRRPNRFRPSAQTRGRVLCWRRPESRRSAPGQESADRRS